MTTPTDTAKLADMMEEIIESRMATIYDDELRAAAAALRELEALKAREAGLREALEPFARQAQIFDDVGGVAFDDQFEPFDLTTNGHRIIGLTVGDLRRARAAITGGA